jgi:Mrp family chromosome partitioning ATPase
MDPTTPITETNERSDLSALAGVLRRRAWIVALATVLGIGAAIVFSKVESKQYSSTAVLLFRPVLLDVDLTGAPLQLPNGEPTREAATNVALVSEESVRVGAAQRLGPPYTASSLKNKVSISSEGKSDLVGVQATAGSPGEAAHIANAMANEYIALAQQSIATEIKVAEARVRAQVPAKNLTASERQALRAALTKLAILGSLGPQDVHLSQPAALPTGPSSPKTLENALIGGIAGLILGLALAFAAEQLDTRLHDVGDIERETRLRLLGSVPRSRRLRNPLGKDGRLEQPDADAFRLVSANLRHQTGNREIRTVLVTSPGAGSGKTTVALNVAAAVAAGPRSRACLVEADLRRPKLGKLLRLPSTHSLTKLLTGRGGTSADDDALEADGEAFYDVPLERAPAASGHAAAGAHHKLSVLPAGPPSGDAAALLDSDAMNDLIGSLKSAYELTVLDGPPPLLVADLVPVAQQVDAVVVVARLGKDKGPELRRLLVELRRLGVEPVGAVANFAPRVKNPYATPSH